MDQKELERKLREILERKQNVEGAKANHTNSARNWITRELKNAFDVLESMLQRRFGDRIDSVEWDRTASCDVLKQTLKFRYMPTVSSLSYTVKLEPSSDGVTGHVQLTAPKPAAPDEEDIDGILDWTQDSIIEGLCRVRHQITNYGLRGVTSGIRNYCSSGPSVFRLQH